MKRALPLMLALSACSMAPDYARTTPPVPASWPVGDAYLRQSEASLPSVTYRDVFRDQRLQRLIETALANNRDLRIAAANIAAARAQYRVQRASIFPVVNVGADYSRRSAGSNTGNVVTGNGSSLSADVGISGFEIDLFGRLRSLSDAAQNRYFGTEAAARAVRLTLVADIADAWLSCAADRSLLQVAQNTVASARRSVDLTAARLKGGIAPRTDLAQAQQILGQAEADVAAQTTAIAQDINALRLLVGTVVDPALLADSIDVAGPTVAALPAGLDSRVLLRRPDIVQAEYELRAANAEIGAARAALFPTISLTGLVGFASNTLTSLFTGNAFTWSVGPAINYPIFRAGAGRAGVELSEAQRDAALASYERAIQSGFRDVADGLARRGTIAAQLAAVDRQTAAAADTYRLTEARYRGGIDTFLASLDAQRSLYTAQRTQVNTRLVAASNGVTLYRALGGDALMDAPL
ncbi:adeC/adeK/oprM family multidrug efflux complex outer membrane factor [Polymorphobacter glacialis]|uniref:AdeC/adeK/oprM family multidrug efflux complex outer membrane factor n=1 Tax=Sandarakinorhabdus glacialis TaxID=1614636 RepID=A0A916ZYX8_9SPHN|nr:efflux transporter outer membrane subunit [Polymorphobacter glacialis]GGE19583.1 adeC/adeK/oprM family multidrug efflux complex outer membrane factor [Polymorphobacter glacialis]